MLQVKRFVNELMTSNCYVVYDNDTQKCIAIDPGSEMSCSEIQFIQEQHLKLDYILVTHEHTDHNWGVNSLYGAFEDVKLICSIECSKCVNKSNRVYFLFYYDNQDYRYQMRQPDVIVQFDKEIVEWNGHGISLILTPGHSHGSMCIEIEDMLFTGDTIMPYKPYFNGRDSNEDDWEKSVEKLVRSVTPEAVVYPGHGDPLTFVDWVEKYKP